MVVNKMEYKQVRRYLLLMISGCIIYLFYSIIVVYYDTQAIKSGPIKSYKIVSEHSGAININDNGNTNKLNAYKVPSFQKGHWEFNYFRDNCTNSLENGKFKALVFNKNKNEYEQAFKTRTYLPGRRH